MLGVIGPRSTGRQASLNGNATDFQLALYRTHSPVSWPQHQEAPFEQHTQLLPGNNGPTTLFTAVRLQSRLPRRLRPGPQIRPAGALPARPEA